MNSNKSHKRRAFIVAGAILAVLIVLASALLVGTGAIFTAKTINRQNMFSTGEFTLSNSKDWAAILSMHLMKPGDVVGGDVTIKNIGSIEADFDLSMKVIADLPGTNAGAGHLVDVLQMSIYDGPAALNDVVFEGRLEDFVKTDLETYSPGEAHTYTFVVTFPDGGTPAGDDSGDNIYQGSSTTVEFDWNVVQH